MTPQGRQPRLVTDRPASGQTAPPRDRQARLGTHAVRYAGCGCEPGNKVWGCCQEAWGEVRAPEPSTQDPKLESQTPTQQLRPRCPHHPGTPGTPPFPKNPGNPSLENPHRNPQSTSNNRVDLMSIAVVDLISVFTVGGLMSIKHVRIVWGFGLRVLALRCGV